MKEQERFERYMRDRYGDISLDLDDERGWYAEIAVRFAWQAWQARTDLAHHRIAELERKLGEARGLLADAIKALPVNHRTHERARELLAEMEQEKE